MKQYDSFVFGSYAFDSKAGKIELNYSLDGSTALTTGDEIHFTETLLFPTPYPLPPCPERSRGATPSLEASLQALHLIAGISYFKTCCPKEIEIRNGSLTKEQADFWNTVYTKGLGEFFYRNNLDFHGLINFPKSESRSPNPDPAPPTSPPPPKKLLVPIGGGKDSIVTAELLKKHGYDVTLLRIGRHPLIEEAARVAGLPLLSIERRLAPELFELNEQGALNGHIPITAYLSILSTVIAELYGFDAVVMSNERSANEGNVEYLGEMINHQWSKSLEFERMFRTYLHGIHFEIEYFSLLRPLSELAITKIFAGLPKYFPVVTSCNKNWRLAATLSPTPSPTGGGARGEGIKWCGTCPKCASAFATLAAFLPREQLLATFKKNLFDERVLQPMYRQLLGIEGFKPFECVGTPEETKAAFFLAHERGDLNETKAMQLFLAEVLPTLKRPKELVAEALKLSGDHCIPERFLPLLHAHS